MDLICKHKWLIELSGFEALDSRTRTVKSG